MLTSTELQEKGDRLRDGYSVEVDDVRVKMVEIPDDSESCLICNVFPLCHPNNSDIHDLCLYVDGEVDNNFVLDFVSTH